MHFKINETKYGELKAERINLTEINAIEDEICPFSNSAENEDARADQLFPEDITKDKFLGSYFDIHAGSAHSQIRENSSSGGLATAMAIKLLEEDEIQEVYHVQPTGNSDTLFNFSVSKTVFEIKQRAKSRYYPVSFNTVINDMKKSDKKKLIIGLPCFIKAISLLQLNKKNPIKGIVYKFAILCGHLKGKFFQEMLAREMNLNPREIVSFDFRKKDANHIASDYFVQADTKKTMKIKGPIGTFYGQDWGMGFYKYKACDYCDDVAGETADMTFGDAWLKKYRADPKGTNIVISRNKKLSKYLNQVSSNLEKLKAADFIESQLASFKHRRNGLQIRLDNNPIIKKRGAAVITNDDNTKSIYLFRERIRDVSKRFFLFSKNIKSFFIFKLLMYPFETYYYFLKTRSLKAFIPVTLKAKLIYFFRKK